MFQSIRSANSSRADCGVQVAENAAIQARTSRPDPPGLLRQIERLIDNREPTLENRNQTASGHNASVLGGQNGRDELASLPGSFSTRSNPYAVARPKTE